MSDVLSFRGGAFSPQNGNLSAGTGVSLTTATNILTPILDGKFQTTYAVAANAAWTATDFNTGLAFPALVGGNSVANTPGQGAVVVFGLSAGVIKAVQGPIATLDMQNNFKQDAPQFPVIPANFVPFAYMIAKARATDGVSIIVGSTAWASYAQTFVNVAMLPSRPQVA